MVLTCDEHFPSPISLAMAGVVGTLHVEKGCPVADRICNCAKVVCGEFTNCDDPDVYSKAGSLG